MKPKDIKEIVDAVERKIEISVNGKIDKIHKILEKQNETANEHNKFMEEFTTNQEAHNTKVNNHMEQVEPFIQAKAGLGVLFKFIVGGGAAVVAWTAIKSFFIH